MGRIWEDTGACMSIRKLSWQGIGQQCAVLCNSLRNRRKSFRGSQPTRQQQLHCEYSLEVYSSAKGNGLRGGVAGRVVVYSPCSNTPYTAPVVFCLAGRDGAGCTDQASIPHTYTHSDKRSEALEVWGALWGFTCEACQQKTHKSRFTAKHVCMSPDVTSKRPGEISQMPSPPTSEQFQAMRVNYFRPGRGGWGCHTPPLKQVVILIGFFT